MEKDERNLLNYIIDHLSPRDRLTGNGYFEGRIWELDDEGFVKWETKLEAIELRKWSETEHVIHILRLGKKEYDVPEFIEEVRNEILEVYVKYILWRTLDFYIKIKKGESIYLLYIDIPTWSIPAKLLTYDIMQDWSYMVPKERPSIKNELSQPKLAKHLSLPELIIGAAILSMILYFIFN